MKNVKSRELSGESGAVEFTPPATDHLISPEEQEALMAIDGVEGLGMSGSCQLCVYVSAPDICRKLPKKIGRFEVIVRTTGIVRSQ